MRLCRSIWYTNTNTNSNAQAQTGFKCILEPTSETCLSVYNTPTSRVT